MNPSIWGPPTWDFLHTITFNNPYRPTHYEKQQTVVFFESVGDMLPCQSCREHYQKNLTIFPVRNVVSDRDALVNWLIHIHNQVNTLLGKRIHTQVEVKRRSNKLYGLMESNYNYNVEGYQNSSYSLTKFGMVGLMVVLIIIIVVIINLIKDRSPVTNRFRK